MTDYYKHKAAFEELFDKFSLGVVIMSVKTDSNGLPVNLVWEYVNQAYADIQKQSREYYIGKSIFDVVEPEEKKWLYNVWDVACNGAGAKETEHYDKHAGKYLLCNFFYVEYGVCLCIVIDNSINRRIVEMLKNSNSIIQSEFKSNEEYVFSYDNNSDVLKYIKCSHNGEVDEKKVYGAITDFRQKVRKGLNISNYKPEIVEKVFCTENGGTADVKLVNYEKGANFSDWFRVTSNSYPEGNSYIVTGLVRKIRSC